MNDERDEVLGLMFEECFDPESPQQTLKNYFEKLISFPLSIFYIVIDTKFTQLHVERLMGSCSDRGRWKWIAETMHNRAVSDDDKKEFYRSHIDGGDMFPRLYFLDESLINEIWAWLKARNLDVIDVRVPKI